MKFKGSFLLVIALLVGCDSNISTIKKSYLDDKRTIEIGSVFDSREICKSTSWEEEKDSLGRNVVIYNCYYIDESKILSGKRDDYIKKFAADIKENIQIIDSAINTIEKEAREANSTEISQIEGNIELIDQAKKKLDLNNNLYLQQLGIWELYNRPSYDYSSEARTRLSQQEPKLNKLSYYNNKLEIALGKVRDIERSTTGLIEDEVSELRSYDGSYRNTTFENLSGLINLSDNGGLNDQISRLLREKIDLNRISDIKDPKDFSKIIPDLKEILQKRIDDLHKERASSYKEIIDILWASENEKLKKIKNKTIKELIYIKDGSRGVEGYEKLLALKMESIKDLNNMRTDNDDLYKIYLLKNFRERFVWVINDLGEYYLIEGDVKGDFKGKTYTIYRYDEDYYPYVILENFKSRDIEKNFHFQKKVI